MTATPRHTADSITDDALDALYAERDRLAAALGTEPEHAEKHAPRPQERPGAVGAGAGMAEAENGTQTGGQLLPGADRLADLLDEFIADAKQRGADPAWLRGARCITGRVRLADPGSLGGGEANAQEALAELRARLVAQHKGAMAASAASSGDAALIHDGERMGLDVAVAELDALALRLAEGRSSAPDRS